MDKPTLKAEYPLPVGGPVGGTITATIPGALTSAELAPWADPPVIWLGQMLTQGTWTGWINKSDGKDALLAAGEIWAKKEVLLLEERNGKLEIKRIFANEVTRQVGAGHPLGLTRLYVNPVTGLVYLGEGDTGVGKRFTQLLEFNPVTGARKAIPLPFPPEDFAFDLDGQAYLRVPEWVARYDFQTWREIPWDYGEEVAKPPLAAVLPTPFPPSVWHSFGLWVSPKGHIVVGGHLGGWGAPEIQTVRDKRLALPQGWKYQPQLFPGRGYDGASAIINVYDERGRPIHQDAGPGLPAVDGVMIDNDDNLYALASANRLPDGNPEPALRVSGTLIKFKPGRLKVTGTGLAPIPLSKTERLNRSFDLFTGRGGAGNSWVDGADGVCGGVGFSGDTAYGSLYCGCPNMRAALDYFRRSFVPETQHCSAAVEWR